MAIETAEDLAVFFDEEEFGEAGVYRAPGDDVGIPVVAIRTQRTEDAQAGGMSIDIDTLIFRLLRREVARPVAGAELLIAGESYQLIGSPRLEGFGEIWSCEVGSD